MKSSKKKSIKEFEVIAMSSKNLLSIEGGASEIVDGDCCNGTVSENLWIGLGDHHVYTGDWDDEGCC